MATKVTMFKAEDGKLLESQQEAESHEWDQTMVGALVTLLDGSGACIPTWQCEELAKLICSAYSVRPKPKS